MVARVARAKSVCVWQPVSSMLASNRDFAHASLCHCLLFAQRVPSFDFIVIYLGQSRPFGAFCDLSSWTMTQAVHSAHRNKVEIICYLYRICHDACRLLARSTRCVCLAAGDAFGAQRSFTVSGGSAVALDLRHRVGQFGGQIGPTNIWQRQPQ